MPDDHPAPPIEPPVAPPVAPRHPATHERHGDAREDPYAWLKDDDWQQVMREPERLKPEIRAYLEAENAYTEAVLARTGDLRQRLVAELKGRIKRDDASVPAPDGAFAYYHRYEPAAEYPRFCRLPRGAAMGEGERVLLDADREAEGKPFFRIGDCAHSPDHSLLAWSADTAGSEYYSIRVREAASGRALPDVIEDSDGTLTWSADGRFLFYVVLDDSHRPSRVYRHRLGDDPADDALVYQEPDPGFFVNVGLSESRRFVEINTHGHSTSEVWLIPADAPERPPALVEPRAEEVEYSLSERDGTLYLLTNADDAEDFKIVTVEAAAPGRAHWRDLVPHRPGCLIRSLLLFRDYLVRLESEDARPRIVVRALADGTEHAIAFEEEAFSLGLAPGYEFDSATLRFVYSSLTTPARTYDYDMATRTRVLLKEQEIPSGHDPAAYVARRLFATAPDGERIPISLVHAKATAIDGSAPLLLYGYGAYGMSMPASFAPNRFSLIDRGFVYAIAHVRGGMERGYRWYRQGRREHKVNTFTDFIAAGEALVAEGFTSAGGIVAHGGSAGGMLMGVAANRRPELFRAVVAEVPFVDVLTTMCDASLPLTPPEWPEWGNPIEDPEAYARIKGYSPYDNIAARAYPHILATAGLTDPRVTYWEPAKWIARLRAVETNPKLLLLKTEMSAGHAGAAGRFAKLDEVALVYAFMLMVAGKA